LNGSECRLEARNTVDPEEKAAWLELAGEWQKLAENMAAEFNSNTPLDEYLAA
jgi:hypothetical protein